MLLFVRDHGSHSSTLDKPVPNPYSWNKLTNVVYIDQPAGTGFSSKHSSPNVTDENQVAEQFLGWWKNFVDTFDLHHRKIFITGESYAGYYVPYIAEAMHNKTDPEYYNVDSVLIYDPSATFGVVQQDAPALPFVEYWSHLFNLNETFMNDLRARHEKCGYKTFLQDVMVFPPKGLLPSPPDVNADDPKCRLWSDIYDAAQLVNPCWYV
jgi:carboxypeptidase D